MAWVVQRRGIVEINMTAGDPDFASVVLLIGPDASQSNGSTTIEDESPAGTTINRVGDAQVDTSEKKFVSSLRLDGTGDYCWLAESTFLPKADAVALTIESWVRLDTDATGVQHIISDRPGSSPPFSYVFQCNASDRSIIFSWAPEGFTAFGVSSSANAIPALGTWFHAALTIETSRLINIWIDGVSVASDTAASSAIPNIGETIGIGARGSNGLELAKARYEDLRVTLGVARYTAAFTPPTGRFLRE